MNKMKTKSVVIASFADQLGMTKKDVASFFSQLQLFVEKEVQTNDAALIPGIGKVVRVYRKARMGRNPATGEQIQIPAKTVVKFRLAKAVKDLK